MIGFGFLRLPQMEGKVDYDAGCALVDRFLELGGQYFDTAYTYLEGQSEEAIRRCLPPASGYSRLPAKNCRRVPS